MFVLSKTAGKRRSESGSSALGGSESPPWTSVDAPASGDAIRGAGAGEYLAAEAGQGEVSASVELTVFPTGGFGDLQLGFSVVPNVLPGHVPTQGEVQAGLQGPLARAWVAQDEFGSLMRTKTLTLPRPDQGRTNLVVPVWANSENGTSAVVLDPAGNGTHVDFDCRQL